MKQGSPQALPPSAWLPEAPGPGQSSHQQLAGHEKRPVAPNPPPP